MSAKQIATPERIPSLTEGDGTLEEWTPHDKARLTLAYVLLGGVAVVMLGASAIYMCAPIEKKDQAQAIWEFAKGFGPPLITLVIGFYFRVVKE